MADWEHYKAKSTFLLLPHTCHNAKHNDLVKGWQAHGATSPNLVSCRSFGLTFPIIPAHWPYWLGMLGFVVQNIWRPPGWERLVSSSLLWPVSPASAAGRNVAWFIRLLIRSPWHLAHCNTHAADMPTSFKFSQVFKTVLGIGNRHTSIYASFVISSLPRLRVLDSHPLQAGKQISLKSWGLGSKMCRIGV